MVGLVPAAGLVGTAGYVLEVAENWSDVFFTYRLTLSLLHTNCKACSPQRKSANYLLYSVGGSPCAAQIRC